MVARASSYLKSFLGAAAMGVALAASINLLVDPYGAYPWARVDALEDFRQGVSTRTGKAEILRQLDCPTVILGTSRAEVGFDPEHPALGEPSCNVALAGSNMYELAHVFRYALEYARPRRVLLFLDFLIFSSARQTNRDFAKSLLNPARPIVEYHLDNLLSWRASLASLKAIRFWWIGHRSTRSQRGFRESLHTQDHFRRSGNSKPQKVRERFEATLRAFLTSPYRYDQYEYSPERVELLRQIVRTSRDQRLELVIAIPPVHALQLEAIRAAGLWETFEGWKRDVVRVVAEESSAQSGWRTEVHDFTGYTIPRIEAVPAPGEEREMRAYWDSSHFKRELGDRVLSELLASTTEGGFGVRLVAATLEAHLSRTRVDRATWVEGHASEVTWVGSLATEGD
jgi:hypothetical protein